METQPTISAHGSVNGSEKRARRGVLVIGAGVSGLTSALCLSRRGFDVTVVADRFAPRVTSVVAGALWEWPPAVCGHHQRPGLTEPLKGLVRDLVRGSSRISPATRRPASSSGR